MVKERLLREFSPKLHFLFEPHRYKVAYSGRYATKSWSAAAALVQMGAERQLRILCARETMRSIADSVHKLLVDQIERLNLKKFYEVTQSAIRGTNGTEIFFAGLRNNIDNIKSIEGCDIVWVEEGQNVSKDSWEVLIPTIRKDGSEIWCTFNPRWQTDSTYQRWVLTPPPGAKVVFMSWRDNRYLTKDMQAEMDHLRTTDPETYEHIYEGVPLSAVAAAIYKNEILRAEKEGRIRPITYAPMIPVDTYWDLGYGDMVSIWFVQATPFEFRLIDYYEDHAKSIDHFVKVLQNKEYTYGVCGLPWDGNIKSLGTGRSIADIMKAKGFRVKLNRKLAVHEGINAVRTIFHQFYIDPDRCAVGLERLRNYQWGSAGSDGREKREPLHDINSHAGDSLRTLAMSIKVPSETAEAAARRQASAPSWPIHRSGGGSMGWVR